MSTMSASSSGQPAKSAPPATAATSDSAAAEVGNASAAPAVWSKDTKNSYDT